MTDQSNIPNIRIVTFDLLRGVAVILMIAAHTAYFLMDSTHIGINALSTYANYVTFIIFLISSAAVSYQAFILKDTGKIGVYRILKRGLAILFAYYIVALFSAIKNDNGLDFSMTLKILLSVILFQRVPAFAEFLFPFIFYPVTFIPLRSIYARISKSFYITFVLGLAFYILGLLVYLVEFKPVYNTIKLLVSGSGTGNSFPLLQYFPVFLTGIYIGRIYSTDKREKPIPRKMLYLFLFWMTMSLVTHLINIFIRIPILAFDYRWPPSLGFLSYGLANATALIMLIDLLKLSFLKPALKILSYIGRDSFDIYITHILILFIYSVFIKSKFSGLSLFMINYFWVFLVSVFLSSINLTKSPSVFNLGPFALGNSGRYKFRKRYIFLSVLFIFISLLPVVNKNVTTGKKLAGFGILISRTEELVNNMNPAVNRNWFIPDRDPILNITLNQQVRKYINNHTRLKYQLMPGQVKGDFIINSQEIYATVDLSDFSPGIYILKIFEQSEPDLYYETEIYITKPLFVAWTFDWEGWDVTDKNLALMEDFSLRHNKLPFTHFFNPRIYVSSVSVQRAEYLTEWVRTRAENFGDEVALHLHMNFDIVTSASVAALTQPRWGYRSDDGYDVLATAYPREDMVKILSWAKEKFKQAGLPEPRGYRSGGWFVNPDLIQALIAVGFDYDSSGRDKKMWNGYYFSPWNLDVSSQPYYPSFTDQNIPGPENSVMLEIANNGGNTNEYSEIELMERAKSYLSGKVLDQPKSLVYLSHPQWADWELPKGANAAGLLSAASYTHNFGPVIFVTTAEIADLWKIN